MEAFFNLIIIAVASYLLGSFPTAILISRKFFGFDIRDKGSGNMGSTNAFRVLGVKWGIIVQLIDIAKGVLAVVVIASLLGGGIKFPGITLFEDMTVVRLIAGISAVMGHMWSVFVGFRGGKGINTAAGMLAGIAPIDVGIAVGFFAVAVIFSGYISLGSLSAAIAFPSSIFIRYNLLHAYIPGYETLIYFALGLAVLLVFQHRKNILRLLKGNENRFSQLQLVKCKKHAPPG